MTFVSFDHRGKCYRLAVARHGAGVWVGFPGGAVYVARKGHASEGRSDGTIRAPMTGRVVDVRAQVGDAVRANDVLVVLEAMKMEYRLTAPQDGRVAALQCTLGQHIDAGVVLVRLDRENPVASVAASPLGVSVTASPEPAAIDPADLPAASAA